MDEALALTNHDHIHNLVEEFTQFHAQLSQAFGTSTIVIIAYPESYLHNLDMAPVILHLRSETKPLEHRSALTPTVTRKLLDKGFKVNVERSPERIFDDEEFTSAGATLVEEGSWPNAPDDHIIIGLKELEDKEPFPLKASFNVVMEANV